MVSQTAWMSIMIGIGAGLISADLDLGLLGLVGIVVLVMSASYHTAFLVGDDE